MQRVLEPELMEEPDQVAAYANADFSASHNRIIEQIWSLFPGMNFAGDVLNLGCGSGDETFRFLNQFPDSKVIGIDGSTEMIARANTDLQRHPAALSSRAHFIVGYIPSEAIPKRRYVAVISNSLVHHMHNPAAFWSAVADHSTKGTAIFIADLRRPISIEEVDELVKTYADGAPEILRTDFRNSLCAAFTSDELRLQLKVAGLSELNVSEIGDRHLIASGLKA